MPKVNIDVYAQLHGADRKINNMEKELRGMKGQAGKSDAALKGLWKQFAAGLIAVGGLAAAFRGAKGLVKSFMDAAVQTENYKVRLEALLGSQEAAAEAMQFFQDVASKVPFTLQDVIEAGTTVTAFGADLKKWTPILTDLAAVMGLDLVDAANALGRAYAGGAGAADIFRERGILQIIKDSAKMKHGIEDITKLTLPQFRDIMYESFTDPKGRIAGAADKLAKTWTGMISMLEDAWFQFRQAVMEAGVYDWLKDQLKGLLEEINRLKETGKLKEWAEKTAAAFVSLIDVTGIFLGQLKSFDQPLFDVARGYSELSMKMIGLEGPQKEMNRLQAEAIQKAIEFKDSLKILNPPMELMRKHLEAGENDWYEWTQRVKEADEKIVAAKGSVGLLAGSFGTLGGIALEAAAKQYEMEKQILATSSSAEAAHRRIKEYRKSLREAGDESKNVTKITRELGETVVPAIKGIKGEVTLWGQEIISVTDLVKELKDELDTMVYATGIPAARDLSDVWSLAVNEMEEDTKGYKKSTKKYLKEDSDSVHSVWNDVADGIRTKWTNEISQMLQGAKSFEDGFKGMCNAVKTIFFDLVADMIAKWMVGFIGDFLDSLKKTADTVVEEVSDATDAASGAVEDMGGGFLDTFKSIAGPIGIGLLISKFVDLKKVGEAVTKTLVSAFEAVSGIIKGVGKVFESVFGAGSNIIAGIGSAISGMTGMLGKLGGLLKAGGQKYREITYWLKDIRLFTGQTRDRVTNIRDDIRDMKKVWSKTMDAQFVTRDKSSMIAHYAKEISYNTWKSYEELKRIVGAQTGMDQIVTRTTLIAAHPGEHVKITPVAATREISRANISGAQFNFNIYGPLVSSSGMSDADLERAGDKFFQIIQYQMRRRGYSFG